MVLLASEFDKSKYLRAEDLPTAKKFRIKDVTVETIKSGEHGEEDQLVVWFTNDKRGLVLNKTNNRTLRGAFGDDVEGWKGKIIVIFQTMVDFRGKMVPGLRVRLLPPKQAATSGNGHAAAAPLQPSSQPSSTTQSEQQVDEFGQPQSSEKPSLAGDLDDEIPF
jgi:hypothetical protein